MVPHVRTIFRSLVVGGACVAAADTRLSHSMLPARLARGVITRTPALFTQVSGVARMATAVRAAIMRTMCGGSGDQDADIMLQTERPFKVLGVQQIAIGGESKSALLKLWVDVLGVPKIGDFESARENVSEAILALGKGPFAVEIDLMQPLDITKKPAVHIPPLNHIGLWIDNLEVAVKHLTESGVRFAPGGIRKGAAGHNVAFVHPKGNEQFPLSGEGVLIELVQAPEDVIKALSK